MQRETTARSLGRTPRDPEPIKQPWLPPLRQKVAPPITRELTKKWPRTILVVAFY